MRDIVTESLIVDGQRIATGVHGTGNPVVLIHGTPSYSYEWRNVMTRLEDAGYRVYVYDLLGYGKSERPLNADTSVAGQEAVLMELLDEWDLERPHIVGHDIGGAIALRFALENPRRVASVTVADTVSYDSWPSETWQEIIDEHLTDYMALSESAFREMLTGQLEMTVVKDDLMTGDTLEAYLAPLQGAFGRASFFYHQVRHYDSRYTEEITDKLAELSVPTQILWGEEDRWQPVAYAHRLVEDIPDAELHVFKDAGHFVMEDAPDRVAGQIASFLDTH